MTKIHGVQFAEGLILDHWEMDKAQGLRPKDRFVELHMKLSEHKTLISQRFGIHPNCLGVNSRLFDCFEKVPNKKWKINVESLDADQILVGKEINGKSTYYSCITIYGLEKL